MKKTELYKYVLDYFKANMPAEDTELVYNTPFQLLVAVVLSAQCTDRRVNIVTEKLFEKYPTAKEMAKVSENDLLKLISSISYPNSK